MNVAQVSSVDPATMEACVRLYAPYLVQKLRIELDAITGAQQSLLRAAWTGQSQANGLVTLSARANSVDEIRTHLVEQGKRWADRKNAKPLAKAIEETIADTLREKVSKALTEAVETTITLINVRHFDNGEPIIEFKIPQAWIDAEFMNLVRHYIRVLVALYRIQFDKDEAGE